MADSGNLTETEILAMAAAADEGREYNPEPKKDEAKATTETDKVSGSTEQKPTSAEEAEPKQEASSEAPATEEKSEEAKSSLTTQPEDSKPDSASEKKQKPSEHVRWQSKRRRRRAASRRNIWRESARRT